MSQESDSAQARMLEEDFGLDSEIADEGAALLLTAIGALSEDVAADAIHLRQDGQAILVMRRAAGGLRRRRRRPGQGDRSAGPSA